MAFPPIPPVEVDFFAIPYVGKFLKWIDGGAIDNGGDYGNYVFVFCVLCYYLAFTSIPGLFSSTIVIFFALSPLWLPYMLFDFFIERYMTGLGKSFYLFNGRTTFRIKLPPEVFKSPEAMEFVLFQIHNTQSPDNVMQTYLEGKRPLPIGLEIVSIGGDVRFYANTPSKKTREAFIASMYSQYPGVELVEEPVDYLGELVLGDPGWQTFTMHMGKKGPSEVPIKTYIDFELNKFPKEEEKVDPMTPMLERLGSIGPNERLYIQFVCTAFRVNDTFRNGNYYFQATENWTKAAQRKIDDIMKRDPETKASLNSGETDFEGTPRITGGERNLIDAIERNMGKPAYSVGIRWTYAAKKGHFQGTIINPIIRTFSQFDTAYQGIGPRWRTDLDYQPFIDRSFKRIDAMKHQEIVELKKRKYFNKRSTDSTFIMTAEELATMFHLPGKVALTPTMGRIPSTRSQAPANLPTGNQNVL